MMLDRRYSIIANDYSSLEQVSDALALAGFGSSNLIVGIDFTASNAWTGSRSFARKSLHHIGDDGINPYEQAITIIGKTLASFDEDNLIPCYGFGDALTEDESVFSFYPDERFCNGFEEVLSRYREIVPHLKLAALTEDESVFSFYPDERFCNGFEEVLSRYREIVPHLKLAGPTSFAPVIEQAMTVVEQSAGQYHVLLIIADGQVTRSVDTESGQLSPQEQKTVDAIVQASKLPLSIILVGVGDGPWDMMKKFDDNIPTRDFDNFQFVNFTEIMARNTPNTQKETEFALSALMEIPTQYKAAIELNLLGRIGVSQKRFALPPPIDDTSSFSRSESTHPNSTTSQTTSPPVPNSTYDDQACPICLEEPKNMAFGCGHQTCRECGETLLLCPVCRKSIEIRIKLY